MQLVKKWFLMLWVVLLFANTVFAIEEREGFIKQLTSSDPNVLTVPEGKRFVFMQILTRDPSSNWNLKIDSSQFLNQNIFGHKQISSSSGAAYAGTFNITFPDRCVTVEQGQTLSFETTVSPSVTIVGYFYDCNCPVIPVADLNKDCKVNFADLAIMASKWLTDNTVLS